MSDPKQFSKVEVINEQCLDDCTITVVSETGSQIGILTESLGA